MRLKKTLIEKTSEKKIKKLRTKLGIFTRNAIKELDNAWNKKT